MTFSALLRMILASALILAPLSSAQSQYYGNDLITSELDRIVRTDAGRWTTSYGYVRSSMRNGRILQQSSSGYTQLWRGYFRYTDGDEGEVRVRVRGDRVECLVYDTDYTTNWCTLDGGGTNFLGAAVAGLVILVIVGSSRDSPRQSDNGYSASERYRQCMRGCVDIAINDPNMYNAARQQCERRC